MLRVTPVAPLALLPQLNYPALNRVAATQTALSTATAAVTAQGAAMTPLSIRR